MYFYNFIVVDKFLLSISITFADIPFRDACEALVDSNLHLSTFTVLVPITYYVPVQLQLNTGPILSPLGFIVNS